MPHRITRDHHRTRQQPRGRAYFVPSSSFWIVVVDDPQARPRFLVPGQHGYHGVPRLDVPASTSRMHLIRLLAAGEMLLSQTRN